MERGKSRVCSCSLIWTSSSLTRGSGVWTRLVVGFGMSSLKYRLKVQVLQFEEGGGILPAVEIGRICVKQVGRETGKKCVIIDVMDKSYVLVTGPKKVTGVRRRRANINHVEPLQVKIEVTRGASDEEVTSVLEAAGMLEEMVQPVGTTAK
jgi:large subunit ribosomal protein L14e